MSTVTRSARGASAFTQAEPTLSQSAVEAGAVFSRTGNARKHTWDHVIDELLRIRNLQDDWDGEGTEAPHPSLVDSAITLAQSLKAKGGPPADRVVASVNGTVYFEWHTPIGYQEIEVMTPLYAECRWVQKGTDTAVVVGLNRCP